MAPGVVVASPRYPLQMMWEVSKLVVFFCALNMTSTSWGYNYAKLMSFVSIGVKNNNLNCALSLPLQKTKTRKNQNSLHMHHSKCSKWVNHREREHAGHNATRAASQAKHEKVIKTTESRTSSIKMHTTRRLLIIASRAGEVLRNCCGSSKFLNIRTPRDERMNGLFKSWFTQSSEALTRNGKMCQRVK